MGGAPSRQGTDKRSVNREEKRKEEIKAVEAAKGPSLFDPYFNIVEVKVYGQARFYNPPPEEPEAEPSLGETAGDAAKAEPGEGRGRQAERRQGPSRPRPKPAKQPRLPRASRPRTRPRRVSRPRPSPRLPNRRRPEPRRANRRRRRLPRPRRPEKRRRRPWSPNPEGRLSPSRTDAV